MQRFIQTHILHGRLLLLSCLFLTSPSFKKCGKNLARDVGGVLVVEDKGG